MASVALLVTSAIVLIGLVSMLDTVRNRYSAGEPRSGVKPRPWDASAAGTVDPVVLPTAARRLAIVALCAVAVAGCGSSSTEQLSAEAVTDKARGIAESDGKIYTHNAILRPGDGRKDTKLLVIVACPPSGDCTLIGRDGETYPDMQTFVDESDDVTSDDEVFANADPTNPDAKPKLALYTKNDGLPWGWYAGGGTLLLLLILSGWLTINRRRRATS